MTENEKTIIILLIDMLVYKAKGRSYKSPDGYEIAYIIILLTPILGPIFSVFGCIVGLVELKQVCNCKRAINIK